MNRTTLHPKKPRRSYSDREKAEALIMLDANAGNCKRTARDLRIPERTLGAWRDRPQNSDVQAMREKYRGDLAACCENLAWKLLGQLEDAPEKVPPSRWATDSAILIDKAQLLRGLPSTIHENVPARIRAALADEGARDLIATTIERLAGTQRPALPPAPEGSQHE